MVAVMVLAAVQAVQVVVVAHHQVAQELRAKVITAAVLAQVMAVAEAEAVLVAQVLQHLLVYIMGRMVAQEQLHHTLVHQ